MSSPTLTVAPSSSIYSRDFTVSEEPADPNDQPLENSYAFTYFVRPPGHFDPHNYSKRVWYGNGLSSRMWENVLLAMIGEQFLVAHEICGAVCSIRNQEDIISVWNRTADDIGVRNRIRDVLRRVLNLPPNTILEYKRHDDCLKDKSSYRHTNADFGRSGAR